MLTLNINGNEEKLHIGCRTFVSLYELLHLLEVPSGKSLSVQVNKKAVEPHKYMLHNISTGDHLIIDSNTVQ
jgi:hypothetical protein